MSSKITKDEIASIIKERIDNFELNVDAEHSGHIRKRTICIVGCGNNRPYGLPAAVIAAHADGLGVQIVRCDEDKISGIRGDIILHDEIEFFLNSEEKMKKMIEEQISYLPNELYKKENHPYGWYRKFEKKRY